MNHIELSVELMSILRALNYSCELKTIEGKSIVMDIAVQGELSVRHQKMIEMLLGGILLGKWEASYLYQRRVQRASS